VSFEQAQSAFDDPAQLSREERIENGEARWQTLARLSDQVVLLIAHTWLDAPDAEHIRIISARRATKSEREIYEQQR